MQDLEDFLNSQEDVEFEDWEVEAMETVRHSPYSHVLITENGLSWSNATFQEYEEILLEKDNAYAERNQVLALACKSLSKEYVVELWQHEGEDWEDEYRNIVAIALPTGWCTWHIHDRELHLFDWLPKGKNKWDGHNTTEKYSRLQKFIKN